MVSQTAETLLFNGIRPAQFLNKIAFLPKQSEHEHMQQIYIHEIMREYVAMGLDVSSRFVRRIEFIGIQSNNTRYAFLPCPGNSHLHHAR